MVAPQIPQTQLARTQNTIAPAWGDRSEIRELLDRFKAGLPNSNGIPESGLLALATASIAHGLDPWNGEIWCIYNKDTGETSIMAGIKGLRKAAKRQMTDRHFYDVSFREVPEEEWHLYATELDAKGRKVDRISICTLRRQDATSNYLAQLDAACRVTGDYAQARELVGEPPRWTGIGIARVGEKSKMEKTRLARKRAEAEATTQAFDLPFANEDFNGSTVAVGVVEDAVDGYYTTGDPPQEPPATTTEPPPEPSAASEELQRNQEGQEPATASQTFPFPPDKRLCDFDKRDWTSFWPFMQKHVGKSSKETNGIVHDAMQIEDLNVCEATFSECLDAVDAYRGAA